ncbi:MAG: hypothetical protein LC800_17570 [Acidobacteria bacterium]|nr:hypothetical protein [Acidobacteriota bacterium]
MDKNTLIAIGILAAVVIAAILVFRRGGVKTKITGPGGTGLDLDASNPQPTPGASIEDAKSHRGSVRAEDHLGRGASVRRAEAEQDVVATSRLPGEDSDPKA